MDTVITWRQLSSITLGLAFRRPWKRTEFSWSTVSKVCSGRKMKLSETKFFSACLCLPMLILMAASSGKKIKPKTIRGHSQVGRGCNVRGPGQITKWAGECGRWAWWKPLFQLYHLITINSNFHIIAMPPIIISTRDLPLSGNYSPPKNSPVTILYNHCSTTTRHKPLSISHSSPTILHQPLSIDHFQLTTLHQPFSINHSPPISFH